MWFNLCNYHVKCNTLLLLQHYDTMIVLIIQLPNPYLSIHKPTEDFFFGKVQH